MTSYVDEADQVFHLDLTGASARRALVEDTAFLDDRPEVWNWDWVIHLPEGATDTTVDDVAGLAARFPGRIGDGITVLVSGDRHLHLWAQVMDHQFQGRQHLVVPDSDAAATVIGRRHVATKMNRI
ncbi:hypothetical protein [Brevundimonas sp. FT23028]|uniref:hypothetical protein n=1 Tax=Brevundimonas sp. FT23028 TaxID=3393748 RepID=UPI003B588E5D